jgi:hypothetical protein
VLKVTRSGKKHEHQFAFEVAAPAVTWSVPPEETIDLHVLLNELVSEERLRAFITPLPEGSCLRG